jgi:hypothetical protein
MNERDFADRLQRHGCVFLSEEQRDYIAKQMRLMERRIRNACLHEHGIIGCGDEEESDQNFFADACRTYLEVANAEEDKLDWAQTYADDGDEEDLDKFKSEHPKWPLLFD